MHLLVAIYTLFVLSTHATTLSEAKPHGLGPLSRAKQHGKKMMHDRRLAPRATRSQCFVRAAATKTVSPSSPPSSKPSTTIIGQGAILLPGQSTVEPDATTTTSQTEWYSSAAPTETQWSDDWKTWWTPSASSATPTAAEPTYTPETRTPLSGVPYTASRSAPPATSSISEVPVPTGKTTLSTASLAERNAFGWFPDWSVGTYPVSSIDWSKLDIVDFAFAVPNAQFDLEFFQDSSTWTLSQLVQAGHAAGKKVRLSIGGWTGSVHFSTAVSTPENRQTFANNIADIYNQFDLDGIDLDWEYPGTQGAEGNIIAPQDSANYLLFLRLLRSTLPSDAFISAATQVWPFADESGRPMKDVSEFAKVLDWVAIMNYDIWGSSSTPGPNSPLSDACGTSTQPLGNAYAAVESWTNAGFPANQLVLGTAAYGYLQLSTATTLRTRRRRRQWSPNTVTVRNANGGTTDGQVNFAELVAQGALAYDDASGTWLGAGGFTREWDKCSSTPWLRSEASGQVVTYDDPESMAAKGRFVRKAGLRGTSTWEITGDMGGSQYALFTAARSAMGI